MTIPPIIRNRNHVVQLHDQFYRGRHQLQLLYSDRMGDNYKGPTIPAQQYCTSHGTLAFPHNAVRAKDNGNTLLLMSPFLVNSM